MGMLETTIQTPRCILAKPTPADKPDLIKLFSISGTLKIDKYKDREGL
ncbi:hypothetical protein PSE_1795 [Pseudovibrio sp. FO-BEG1]|nr:hypothetical protein PSE_1795 [Pseudovibrio sp. FO-BEG1]